MILYAVGRGNRLFAIAHVTREARSSGNPNWPHRVDIGYDILLPVCDGVTIDNVATERNLIGSIQRGKSYIELRQSKYEQAVALLVQAGGATGTVDPIV